MLLLQEQLQSRFQLNYTIPLEWQNATMACYNEPTKSLRLKSLKLVRRQPYKWPLKPLIIRPAQKAQSLHSQSLEPTPKWLNWTRYYLQLYNKLQLLRKQQWKSRSYKLNDRSLTLLICKMDHKLTLFTAFHLVRLSQSREKAILAKVAIRTGHICYLPLTVRPAP